MLRDDKLREIDSRKFIKFVYHHPNLNCTKVNNMNFTRRKFLNHSFLGSILVGFPGLKKCALNQEVSPVVVSTWKNQTANQKAWELIAKGERALDAVEAGVRVVEADPNDQSVGYGGRPDRDGNVTLDACIMDENGNAGGVCYLQNIKHPISVARKVMENTPHVLLAGEGAFRFAESEGFESENLLTETSRKQWEEWKKTSAFKPIINIENHDTIGMLAMDKKGDISGACTTSGLAYKLGGRVGDSPIIGAGLFVDNEVGGAVATGMGELVLKTLGSFLVVELMRQGRSPELACKEAVERIMKKEKKVDDFQVGFLAINKQGQTGAYSLHKGFSYVINDMSHSHKVNSSKYIMD